MPLLSELNIHDMNEIVNNTTFTCFIITSTNSSVSSNQVTILLQGKQINFELILLYLNAHEYCLSNFII